MAARRRPRELGLQRAGSSVRPTRRRVSSVGARRRFRRAQTTMGGGRSNELTRSCQWRTGDGSVLVRGEEAAAFIVGRKAVGVLPCAPRQPSCGVGCGMAGVRWKGGGDRGPMAALGRRGVASTHAPRGSAKDPQTSRTGTKEQGARTTGRRPASACVYGRHGGTPTRPGASSAGTLRARGALALAQFKVALFD
jgi:hypothetical protein